MFISPGNFQQEGWRLRLNSANVVQQHHLLLISPSRIKSLYCILLYFSIRFNNRITGAFAKFIPWLFAPLKPVFILFSIHYLWKNRMINSCFHRLTHCQQQLLQPVPVCMKRKLMQGSFSTVPLHYSLQWWYLTPVSWHELLKFHTKYQIKGKKKEVTHTK